MKRLIVLEFVFLTLAYADEFSHPRPRYLYGSTHPTVSQSSISGRLMQEGDLFIGDGYEISTDNTRIIKSPNLPFRINGLLYYWDPVFVPKNCPIVQKSNSSRYANEVTESSSSSTLSSTRSSSISTTTTLPLVRGDPIALLPPIPETPIVFIASRQSTSSSTTSTSSPSTSSSSSTSTTKSSTSTSTVKSTSPSTSTSSNDIDDVILFLQSLHSSDFVNTTLGDEIEIPRARRQIGDSRLRSSSTMSTTLPTPIQPSLNITAVDPCFNVSSGSPEVCTRLLDRRDNRDPFMRITFPNGTKVAELAWRCPKDMHCCEWECCETRPVRRSRHSALPFVVTFFFIVVAVIICIFCFKHCKESERRRRNIENFGPNDYQMTVNNPPQPVDREDLDEGPREPPPVPRMHFHAHEEPRPSFAPPPIPPPDRVHGTYR